jgi:hypothetical protein
MAATAILSIFVWFVNIRNHLKLSTVCLRDGLAVKLNGSAIASSVQ